MLALFVEARRSDHWAMLIHHVATMTLIAGSYVCNFVPIGALVMITHDAADSFLEIAKIFNYMCKARPWAQKVRASAGRLSAGRLSALALPNQSSCPDDQSQHTPFPPPFR